MLGFKADLQLSIGAPGCADDGPGDDVGVVLVGLDAVHVLVQDGDLLLVVPAGRSAEKSILDTLF
jgi:hypothetical protein